MRVTNITRDQLQKAANDIGVKVDIESLNKKNDRFRVKVSPGDYKDDDGNRKYQRISASPFQKGRKVHAVCWHGFRDFFRACFEQEPNAVFKTMLDTWNGSQDFESRYRLSGRRNIGTQMKPVAMCQACACPDSGEAE
jgi:hypothetical protein